MEERKETGFAVLFGMVLVLIIALTALFGCTTKQKVLTEYITVHDTIHAHKMDTLREVSYQIRVDTIRQQETHTITINDVGDTVREIHHYHDTEKVILVDSTDRYKSVVDSLRAALNTERQKQKEVIRTKNVVRWWEWLLIVGIVGGLVYGAKMIRN